MNASAAEIRARKRFNEAFGAAREPRSPEYKAGALAALRFRLGALEVLSCPYPTGTAPADAWLSGTDEGHRLGREVLEVHP